MGCFDTALETEGGIIIGDCREVGGENLSSSVHIMDIVLVMAFAISSISIK
jgi:hypothetical protein